MAGPPLSGKSTMVRLFEKHGGWVCIDNDVVRQSLFDWEQGLLLSAEEERDRMLAVYRFSHALAAICIAAGLSVVIASTYSRQLYREELHQMVVDLGVGLFVFCLSVPQGKLEERLGERLRSGSSSNLQTLAAVTAVHARFAEFPNGEAILLHTEGEPRTTFEFILSTVE